MRDLAAVDLWLPVALGIVLVLFGRRLFWLLLGTVGFLFAFELVSRFASDTPRPLVWVLAVGVGLAAAVAAIFLQRVAVAVAGFVGGGLAVVWLLEFYGVNLGSVHWLIVLVGAALAGALSLAVLEETLMVLSSMLGAALLVGVSGLDGLPAVIFFAAIMIIGITAQNRTQAKKSA